MKAPLGAILKCMGPKTNTECLAITLFLTYPTGRAERGIFAQQQGIQKAIRMLNVLQTKLPNASATGTFCFFSHLPYLQGIASKKKH